MAEETQSTDGGEGGGKSSSLASFKSILTKKVGGVPVWIGLLAAILILAFVLKRRSASKATATDADTSGTGSSTAGDVTSQTFPYGQPMNYTSDVYINNPATSTTDTTTTTTPSTPSGTVTVLPGWHVDTWIRDLNNQGYNVTYADLVAANPSLVPNIDWNPTDKINFFKAGQQYTVPPQDLPKSQTATSNV